MERDLPARVPGVDGRRGRLGKLLAPYLLIFPGGLWLVIFFLIPVVVMLSMALQTGTLEEGFRLTWNFGEFVDAIRRLEQVNANHPVHEGLEHAEWARGNLIPAMEATRAVADRLERIVADDLWPLPKYSEMLFIK